MQTLGELLAKYKALEEQVKPFRDKPLVQSVMDNLRKPCESVNKFLTSHTALISEIVTRSKTKNEAIIAIAESALKTKSLDTHAEVTQMINRITDELDNYNREAHETLDSFNPSANGLKLKLKEAAKIICVADLLDMQDQFAKEAKLQEKAEESKLSAEPESTPKLAKGNTQEALISRLTTVITVLRAQNNKCRSAIALAKQYQLTALNLINKECAPLKDRMEQLLSNTTPAVALEQKDVETLNLIDQILQKCITHNTALIAANATLIADAEGTFYQNQKTLTSLNTALTHATLNPSAVATLSQIELSLPPSTSKLDTWPAILKQSINGLNLALSNFNTFERLTRCIIQFKQLGSELPAEAEESKVSAESTFVPTAVATNPSIHVSADSLQTQMAQSQVQHCDQQEARLAQQLLVYMQAQLAQLLQNQHKLEAELAQLQGKQHNTQRELHNTQGELHAMQFSVRPLLAEIPAGPSFEPDPELVGPTPSAINGAPAQAVVTPSSFSSLSLQDRLQEAQGAFASEEKGAQLPAARTFTPSLVPNVGVAPNIANVAAIPKKKKKKKKNSAAA